MDKTPVTLAVREVVMAQELSKEQLAWMCSRGHKLGELADSIDDEDYGGFFQGIIAELRLDRPEEADRFEKWRLALCASCPSYTDVLDPERAERWLNRARRFESELRAVVDLEWLNEQTPSF